MARSRLALLLAAPLAFACGKPDVCAQGEDPPAVKLTRDDLLGYVPYAHSHNDYEHTRPLLDALDATFYSIEADIYFAGGSFEVKHMSWDSPKGVLKGLYLDPLQARVTSQGSVYGDGRQVALWLDLKDQDGSFPSALEALLAQYPMLTAFGPSGATEGPVTVILTGDAKMKGAFVEQSPRHAARDSNDFSPSDPPSDGAWTAYALDWGTYLDWDGTGAVPQQADLRMRCIVAKAHALGRKVRFYAAPDRSEVWQAGVDRGVDFIHTNDLQGARSYLLTAP